MMKPRVINSRNPNTGQPAVTKVRGTRSCALNGAQKASRTVGVANKKLSFGVSPAVAQQQPVYKTGTAATRMRSTNGPFRSSNRRLQRTRTVPGRHPRTEPVARIHRGARSEARTLHPRWQRPGPVERPMNCPARPGTTIRPLRSARRTRALGLIRARRHHAHGILLTSVEMFVRRSVRDRLLRPAARLAYTEKASSSFQHQRCSPSAGASSSGASRKTHRSSRLLTHSGLILIKCW